jgi:hypothetical protein
VILSLPAVIRIGMPGHKAEIRASVLQCEAAAFGDDVGSKAGVVAVDKRSSVSLRYVIHRRRL